MRITCFSVLLRSLVPTAALPHRVQKTYRERQELPGGRPTETMGETSDTMESKAEQIVRPVDFKLASF